MNDIKIYDTTLRDGSQGVGVSFSLEDKLKIARALDDFGVHYIEGGWPGSNPKDISFFDEVRGMDFSSARICAFSSTKLKNIDIRDDANIDTLVRAEAQVVTIFGKSWDLHVTKALNAELVENLDMIYSTVLHLKSYADEVIFDAEHFFDGFKANPGYALETLEAAQEAGADWVVLCDTNGGTLPGECESMIEKVKEKISAPLGIHAHNDGELAVANSLVSVGCGVSMVQGTVNGLGERCGNANLCSVIPNLSLKTGYSTVPMEGMRNLKRLSDLVSELSNRGPAAHLPYVGNHAFAHKGGIHVSAVNKEPRTYEHIVPETVGNRRMVTVSELSGRSNILARTREMGIDVKNNSPEIKKVLDKVKEMESRGYYFEGADASFELLCKSLMGKAGCYFTLDGYRVMTWKNGDGKSWSEATIKAGIPADVARAKGLSEPVEHTSADGKGPVEALDRALRKVLEKFYPQLKDVKLTDYKVRILNEEDGTQAVTRVLIHSADARTNRRWGTVGVSGNIIDASWQALVESLIYKLVKDEEGPAAVYRTEKSAVPALNKTMQPHGSVSATQNSNH